MSIGLPANLPAGVIPEDPSDDRDWVEFTLPKTCVGKKFFGRFSETDLVVRVTELDTEAMEHATKRAGGTQNTIKVGQEMTFLSIMQVGDWSTKGRYEDLKVWWKLIGFKGQSLIQRAMETLHHVEEDDIDMFLASARAKP